MATMFRLYQRWMRRKVYRTRQQLEGLFGDNFPAVFFRTL